MKCLPPLPLPHPPPLPHPHTPPVPPCLPQSFTPLCLDMTPLLSNVRACCASKRVQSFRPTTTVPLFLFFSSSPRSVSNNSIPSNLPSLFRMCSLCPCSWRHFAGKGSGVWHALLCFESGSSLNDDEVPLPPLNPLPPPPGSPAAAGCSALRYGGTFCPSKSCYLCFVPPPLNYRRTPQSLPALLAALLPGLTSPLFHFNVSLFFSCPVTSCLS